MTQEEFLTHVNDVAKASNTEADFPELNPSKARAFARFGITGDELKKNELVVYVTKKGELNPIEKFNYGILGAPIISNSHVTGWYVRTPDNQLIKLRSSQIGRLNRPFVFKQTEMQSIEGTVPYAPYAGQLGVMVVRPTAREAMQVLRGERTPAAAAATP